MKKSYEKFVKIRTKKYTSRSTFRDDKGQAAAGAADVTDASGRQLLPLNFFRVTHLKNHRDKFKSALATREKTCYMKHHLMVRHYIKTILWCGIM